MGDNPPEIVNGPGVIGEYPIVTKDSPLFVYESCCPTPVLGTTMSGYFTFKYLEGPNKNTTFKAMIDPFTLMLDEGTQIADNPLYEQMNQLM